MRKTVMTVLIVGVIALGATAAYAAAGPGQSQQQTPKGWSYELQGNKRVPKSNRITRADGSWREELKQGNCVTVKEKSATGEYKETRECNPN